MIGKHGIEQTRPELAAHDTAIKADIGDFSAQSNLTTLLAALGIPDTSGKPLYTCLITDRLDNATYGLEQLTTDVGANQTDLDAILADIGDFSAQSNLVGLLNTLGIPDTSGKPLYTVLVTDLLGHGTHGLVQLQADIAAIPTTMVGTDGAALASVWTSGLATNIGTTNSSVADGTYGLSALQVLIAALQTDLDNGTDGLGALKALIDAIPTTMVGTDDAALATDLATMQGNVTDILTDTGTAGVVLGTKASAFKRLAGEIQMAETTLDLNQAAASYDLFTGTTEDCWLIGFSIKMPDDLCDDTTLTSISVQTDDSTPVELIDPTDQGLVANLTAEAELTWEGKCRINVGTKIQLTIAGGAEGAEYITTATAEYRAINDTGYLA